jgi:hypothetical protein
MACSYTVCDDESVPRHVCWKFEHWLKFALFTGLERMSISWTEFSWQDSVKRRKARLNVVLAFLLDSSPFIEARQILSVAQRSCVAVFQFLTRKWTRPYCFKQGSWQSLSWLRNATPLRKLKVRYRFDKDSPLFWARWTQFTSWHSSYKKYFNIILTYG